METKDNQREAYFLGENKNSGVNVRKKWLMSIVACLIGICILCLIFIPKQNKSLASSGNVLGTVSVLPEGGTMPVFGENGDVNDFLKWVMLNIKYPEGYEDRPARVVVSFVVQTDGTLGQFKVVESSDDEAYAKSVIDLLKRCPRWKPARLSDGKAVGMEFTLPVSFCQTIEQ